MGYTEVFSGSPIFPSTVSYIALAPDADTQLFWPTEDVTSDDIAAGIVEVTPGAAGLSVALPQATKASPGQTVLFYNAGSDAFVVTDYDGNTILNVTAGLAWVVYLTDNSTEAGTWRVYQLGSTISQAQAGALAGAGLVAIGSMLASNAPIQTKSNNYTVGVNDRANVLVWNGGAGTFSLPAVSSVPTGFVFALRNQGTGALALTPNGSDVLNGVAGATSFAIADSSFVITDGVSWWTLGLGQNPIFALDFVTISVAGSGTYTLGNASASELNRIIYRFTGLLTGDRTVIVPGTLQQYWVDNQTTGAFALIISTTGQVSPPEVAQGGRLILYCDGTDVFNADTATGITPSAFGTALISAVNASAGRTVLGATSLGNALFISASQSAAQSALGVYSTAQADAAALAIAIALG